MNVSHGDDSATARLARFVATTTYDDVPVAVADVVRWVLLDTIGVTVAGQSADSARSVTSLARDFAGPGRCTVMGTDLRCDPAWAALVNGTAGHAHDYDDQSWSMGGHPSVVLLPVILALAEAHDVAYRDLVKAYAVGFEVACFLGETVNPDHYGHGWHTTGTVGAVAAAAAAASLLRLDQQQATHALSISASSAAGLRQNFGTGVKPFHAGNAARSGVIAAELARRGLEGNSETLEGRWGFISVFTPSGTHETSSGSLGAPWRCLDPGVATKVFPSCGATHPAIGCILELRDKGLHPDDVANIEVRVVDMTARILEHHRPTTGAQAKFSMEYCLARTLVSGPPRLNHFADDVVTEPAVVRLIEQTQMKVDPVLTREWLWGTPRPTEITVRLTDGEVLHARADLPPGSPGNFRRDMLEAKFEDCMRHGDVRGSVHEISRSVDELGNHVEVGALMELLVARS